MRAESEASSGFAMALDLFGEPLKPFPSFLRTCTPAFVFDVAAQFTPGDTHCAPEQLIDNVQRNHVSEDSKTQRLENAGYRLDGLKKTGIGLDL